MPVWGAIRATRQNGFRDALTEARKSPKKPGDASAYYADLGHLYPWMSPTYVAEQMTEPMLHGYMQRAKEVKRQYWRGQAAAIISDIIERIMPFFGAKVRR